MIETDGEALADCLGPARLSLSALRLGNGPLLMTDDEFALDIFLKLHHPRTDIAVRHPGRQKLIGDLAAFGLPEFYRIRAMPPTEFTGATLDVGRSGSRGKNNELAFIEGGGSLGHFSSHRTQVPLILSVV
jgi:hypothetical protein